MIKINGLEVQTMTFSGGEVNPRLPQGLKAGTMNIIAWLQSSDDIMNLLLVINALGNQFGDCEIHITVPYFPYARQDRVCSIGEAIGVDVMAELIPSHVKSITIFDLHNEDKKLETYSKVKLLSLLDITRIIDPDYTKDTILVAPDAGATNKVKRLASYYGLDWIQGKKLRDPSTGELSGFGFDTDLRVDFTTKDLIVVDDICDGGGTFIGLGSVLNKQLYPKSLSLYVTHGIFSRGFTALEEHFDHIYTTNTVLKEWQPREKLTVYKVVS